MKRGTHGDHQFERFGDGGERRGGGPGVERRRVDAFDVVQIQLGDQREVEADLFAALREPLDVFPGRFHVFVVDVAQPTAETPASSIRMRIRRASFSEESPTRRAKGSKPTTRAASATKFESALTS